MSRPRRSTQLKPESGASLYLRLPTIVVDRGFHHIDHLLRQYWQGHGSAMVNNERLLSGWHSSAATGRIGRARFAR
jgi:hypothetical protein